MRPRARVALPVVSIALAVLSAACASSPGGVPRPFPGAPVVGTRPQPPAPLEPRESSEPDLPDAIADLLNTALDLRGVPYRNGGSSPDGFDCSGFTQWVFAQHGVVLPREVREQFRVGEAIDEEEVAPGDLLFFSTTGRGATHVAIALGPEEFVHAPSSTGVVRVERLGATYWSERFVGGRRVQKKGVIIN